MEAKNSTYKIRVRAVEAVRQGMAVAGMAKTYHVNRSTVHRWLTQYKTKSGNKGLIRQPVSGRPSILGTISNRQLLSIVLKPATHFGHETDFWTCPRLCQVIRKKFRIKLSRWTIWRWLRDAGLTYQKPQRKYFEADEKKRQEWIWNELPKINEAVRKYRAILYFQDESHLSLTAILGKTWSLCGKAGLLKQLRVSVID